MLSSLESQTSLALIRYWISRSRAQLLHKLHWRLLRLRRTDFLRRANRGARGVNVQVGADASNSLPLDIAIRGVDSSGLPNSTILAQTTLNSSSSFLDQLITFRQEVRVTAGTEYAIVVSYEGLPQGGLSGGWDGGLDNPYPRGTAVASSDYGVSWFSLAGLDLEFQTYVEPLKNPKAHHHHRRHHHQHHRHHHHSARTAHA